MIFDNEFRIFPDPSGEAIERYCAEALEKIGLAKDKEEAMKIKGEICARLADQCASGLITQATTSYVDQVIEKRWGSAPDHPDPRLPSQSR